MRVRLGGAPRLRPPRATTIAPWACCPRKLDLSHFSMWRGNHTMKTGASFTYDVTKQIFAPLQTAATPFSGSPAVAPRPVPVLAGIRAHSRGAVDFRKLTSRWLFQDDWPPRQPDDQQGLRYDSSSSRHSDWPAGTTKQPRPRVGLPGIRRGDQNGHPRRLWRLLLSSTRSSPVKAASAAATGW